MMEFEEMKGKTQVKIKGSECSVNKACEETLQTLNDSDTKIQ